MYLNTDIIYDNLKDALNQTTKMDMSCAHLPVAKQIIFDKTVTLQLPQIGDIFLGIVNHKIIKKITYILSRMFLGLTVGHFCRPQFSPKFASNFEIEARALT